MEGEHNDIGAVMDLKEKIETRRAVISVIGLGYVGLPLARLFAESGFSVIGIDVDERRVESLNREESYTEDFPNGTSSYSTPSASNGLPLSSDTPKFHATADFDAIRQSDVVVVCVPTPLSKTKDPDLSYIISATEEIAERLHKGMLIVLESTTFPGTTEELVLPMLEKAIVQDETLKVGEDMFLAYSPERIDPGRSDWTLQKTPKVLGGITENCKDVAKTLYESIVEQVVQVSTPRAAEMVKLLENTFRATNIALVNEFAIMCDRLGVDVWEVIDAAKTKPFGFMPFYPGPGLGGHCIPVDPQFLAWKLKTLNYNARFVQLAEEINFSMPETCLRPL